MTYRASGRKSAPARRPVGHFTSKECAMNLGINAISLQPPFAIFTHKGIFLNATHWDISPFVISGNITKRYKKRETKRK